MSERKPALSLPVAGGGGRSDHQPEMAPSDTPSDAPSRRQAMQWVLAAVAASAFAPSNFAQEVGRTPTPQENASRQPNPPPHGYGLDPNLKKFYKPGAFWPLTFTDAQRATVTALADVIIPKDDLGPAASEVGVPAMLDEWVSAPYPQQQADRPLFLEGLAWLEAESAKRFSKNFAALSDDQKHAICDDICHPPAAKTEFRKGAKFFTHFRSLAAAAYYATPARWRAIGYVGNAPLSKFDGPPQAVLDLLGVTQTVADPE